MCFRVRLREIQGLLKVSNLLFISVMRRNTKERKREMHSARDAKTNDFPRRGGILLNQEDDVVSQILFEASQNACC